MSSNSSNKMRQLGAKLRVRYEAYKAQKLKDTRINRISNRTRSFTQNSRMRLKEYGRKATEYQGKFNKFRRDPSKFTRSMTGEVRQARGERNPFGRKRGIRE